jgi:uncharacterized membrane protein
VLVFRENGMGSVHERANRILIAGTHLHPLLRSVPLAAALAALGALAACTTPEQRAAHKQAEVEEMMVVYGPACQRLGYAPNSDPWRNCVLQLNVQDDLLRYQMSPSYSCNGWGPGYWRGGCW